VQDFAYTFFTIASDMAIRVKSDASVLDSVGTSDDKFL